MASIFFVLFIFHIVACSYMLCQSTISANHNSISIFWSATIFMFSSISLIASSIFRTLSWSSPNSCSALFLSSSDFLFSSLVRYNSSKISILPCRQCWNRAHPSLIPHSHVDSYKNFKPKYKFTQNNLYKIYTSSDEEVYVPTVPTTSPSWFVTMLQRTAADIWGSVVGNTKGSSIA